MTPSAISRSVSGGVATSCAPATASTGAAISPSRSRTSKPASAPQTCDVALVVGVAGARAAARRPRSGSRSRNPAPNQRSADPATITGVPGDADLAIRPVHIAASPIFAPVHSSTAEVTRAGRVEQQLQADAPPTESPA